jgi:four helix bundle protein
MPLIVEELALEAIVSIRSLVPRIARFDRDLAKHLKEAANSVALNTSEGAGSGGGNKRARYDNARGSAKEALMALRAGAAWGYVSKSDIEAGVELYDRLGGMLWRLARGRG